MPDTWLRTPEGGFARVSGIGLLCPGGIGADGATGGRPGAVPGFRPRAFIQDRKSLKLMTRSVQLGVSAVNVALAADPAWHEVPAPRRGIFVGASPQPGDPDDLRPAMEAARGEDGGFDLGRFAREGIPLIHPLWLVRGLSNNVIGFASALHDLQGVNANWCDGPSGGWTALVEGARAIAEGRAELVIAGGADALEGAEPLLGGRRCGDGAAFLLLRAGQPAIGDRIVALDLSLLEDEEHLLGYLGAAAWPVTLARVLMSAA
jgi:hypothetical protein